MKQKPILFSAPMVRAILAGHKTQTRRIVKQCKQFKDWNSDPRGAYDFLLADNQSGAHFLVAGDHGFTDLVPCTYGKPGTQLWVREEHYRFGHWEPVLGVQTKGGRRKWRFVADSRDVTYDAPAVFRKGRHHKDSDTPAWHKRLARFMPRSFSRITLEVESVRVERLQEISEEDAKAEGVTKAAYGEPGYTEDDYGPMNYRDGFELLWESINGTGSWDQNPYCWVLSFKRI